MIPKATYIDMLKKRLVLNEARMVGFLENIESTARYLKAESNIEIIDKSDGMITFDAYGAGHAESTKTYSYFELNELVFSAHPH